MDKEPYFGGNFVDCVDDEKSSVSEKIKRDSLGSDHLKRHDDTLHSDDSGVVSKNGENGDRLMELQNEEDMGEVTGNAGHSEGNGGPSENMEVNSANFESDHGEITLKGDALINEDLINGNEEDPELENENEREQKLQAQGKSKNTGGKDEKEGQSGFSFGKIRASFGIGKKREKTKEKSNVDSSTDPSKNDSEQISTSDKKTKEKSKSSLGKISKSKNNDDKENSLKDQSCNEPEQKKKKKGKIQLSFGKGKHSKKKAEQNIQPETVQSKDIHPQQEPMKGEKDNTISKDVEIAEPLSNVDLSIGELKNEAVLSPYEKDDEVEMQEYEPDTKPKTESEVEEFEPETKPKKIDEDEKELTLQFSENPDIRVKSEPISIMLNSTPIEYEPEDKDNMNICDISCKTEPVTYTIENDDEVIEGEILQLYEQSKVKLHDDESYSKEKDENDLDMEDEKWLVVDNADTAVSHMYQEHPCDNDTPFIKPLQVEVQHENKTTEDSEKPVSSETDELRDKAEGVENVANSTPEVEETVKEKKHKRKYAFPSFSFGRSDKKKKKEKEMKKDDNDHKDIAEPEQGKSKEKHKHRGIRASFGIGKKGKRKLDKPENKTETKDDISNDKVKPETTESEQMHDLAKHEVNVEVTEDKNASHLSQDINIHESNETETDTIPTVNISDHQSHYLGEDQHQVDDSSEQIYNEDNENVIPVASTEVEAAVSSEIAELNTSDTVIEGIHSDMVSVDDVGDKEWGLESKSDCQFPETVCLKKPEVVLEADKDKTIEIHDESLLINASPDVQSLINEKRQETNTAENKHVVFATNDNSRSDLMLVKEKDHDETKKSFDEKGACVDDERKKSKSGFGIKFKGKKKKNKNVKSNDMDTEIKKEKKKKRFFLRFGHRNTKKDAVEKDFSKETEKNMPDDFDKKISENLLINEKPGAVGNMESSPNPIEKEDDQRIGEVDFQLETETLPTDKDESLPVDDRTVTIGIDQILPEPCISSLETTKEFERTLMDAGDGDKVDEQNDFTEITGSSINFESAGVTNIETEKRMSEKNMEDNENHTLILPDLSDNEGDVEIITEGAIAIAEDEEEEEEEEEEDKLITEKDDILLDNAYNDNILEIKIEGTIATAEKDGIDAHINEEDIPTETVEANSNELEASENVEQKQCTDQNVNPKPKEAEKRTKSHFGFGLHLPHFKSHPKEEETHNEELEEKAKKDDGHKSKQKRTKRKKKLSFGKKDKVQPEGVLETEKGDDKQKKSASGIRSSVGIGKKKKQHIDESKTTNDSTIEQKANTSEKSPTEDVFSEINSDDSKLNIPVKNVEVETTNEEFSCRVFTEDEIFIKTDDELHQIDGQENATEPNAADSSTKREVEEIINEGSIAIDESAIPEVETVSDDRGQIKEVILEGAVALDESEITVKEISEEPITATIREKDTPQKVDTINEIIFESAIAFDENEIDVKEEKHTYDTEKFIKKPQIREDVITVSARPTIEVDKKEHIKVDTLPSDFSERHRKRKPFASLGWGNKKKKKKEDQTNKDSNDGDKKENDEVDPNKDKESTSCFGKKRKPEDKKQEESVKNDVKVDAKDESVDLPVIEKNPKKKNVKKKTPKKKKTRGFNVKLGGKKKSKSPDIKDDDDSKKEIETKAHEDDKNIEPSTSATNTNENDVEYAERIASEIVDEVLEEVKEQLKSKDADLAMKEDVNDTIEVHEHVPVQCEPSPVTTADENDVGNGNNEEEIDIESENKATLAFKDNPDELLPLNKEIQSDSDQKLLCPMDLADKDRKDDDSEKMLRDKDEDQVDKKEKANKKQDKNKKKVQKKEKLKEEKEQRGKAKKEEKEQKEKARKDKQEKRRQKKEKKLKEKREKNANKQKKKSSSMTEKEDVPNADLHTSQPVSQSPDSDYSYPSGVTGPVDTSTPKSNIDDTVAPPPPDTEPPPLTPLHADKYPNGEEPVKEIEYITPATLVGAQTSPPSSTKSTPAILQPVSDNEIEVIEPVSHDLAVPKHDENSNKTGTIRLYFANQPVRDEDKTASDAVVLPVLFNKYTHVYLTNPQYEESRWVAEKGLQKWMDRQKHRIYGAAIKIKRRSDGSGLFVKFRYQDGLVGRQFCYYGDITLHKLDNENSKVLHCVIYTDDEEIYTLELRSPPSHQEYHMDGTLNRLHIPSGAKGWWDAAIERPHERVQVYNV